MQKTWIGLGLLFGIVAGFSALAGGCSTTTDSVATDGGSKPTSDGAIPTEDGSMTCPNSVDSSQIFDVLPPKSGTQGSCTAADLALAAKGGSLAALYAGISATCQTCLFSEAADTMNNQFFIWVDTTHTSAVSNIGACPGSPLSGGSPDCGKAIEHIQLCIDQACPTDDQGNAVCASQSACQTAATAAGGPCATYQTELRTACTQAVIDACFDSTGDITPGIDLLCGDAATDGATDASSDGATDAGTD